MGVKIDSVSASPETQHVSAGWCVPYMSIFPSCKVGNLRLTYQGGSKTHDSGVFKLSSVSKSHTIPGFTGVFAVRKF